MNRMIWTLVRLAALFLCNGSRLDARRLHRAVGLLPRVRSIWSLPAKRLELRIVLGGGRNNGYY